MDLSHKFIRIGSRGSQLALAQVEIVKENLKRYFPDLKTETIIIKTKGDQILDRNLNEIGGKGLFITEIEDKLLNKEIDIAVHSMKDMVAFLPEGLTIASVLNREDPRDAIVSKNAFSIKTLPKGALIGTSSPRRAAQLLSIRPDARVIQFRGNIQTRMQKLRDGVVDATFLAMAGLNRSKMLNEMVVPVDIDEMLPAVAQGVIGIECREEDYNLREMLDEINDVQTAICVEAERAFLKLFEGSCRTPIAAYATLDGEIITLKCQISRVDGSEVLTTTHKGAFQKAEDLGIKAALELKEKIDESFFDG